MSIANTRSVCRSLCLLLAISLLVACGFEVRGTADLAFHNLLIQGPGLSITKALEKQLEINGVNIVNSPQKAELVLNLMSEGNEERILSLSAAGVVREYELFYRVNFRLREPSSETWGPVQTIENRRDFTYDDSQLLAKQYEQQRLYQDMRNDAVRELMRRLVVQKPQHVNEPAAK